MFRFRLKTFLIFSTIAPLVIWLAVKNKVVEVKYHPPSPNYIVNGEPNGWFLGFYVWDKYAIEIIGNKYGTTHLDVIKFWQKPYYHKHFYLQLWRDPSLYKQFNLEISNE